MGEVCAARERLNHRDRLSWMHTAHVLAMIVNVNRSRKQPYEVKDFYPFDFESDEITQPTSDHEAMFKFMNQQLNQNGKK